jgi:hypothetical protein
MQNDHHEHSSKPAIKLVLQPNSEREDERQPGFVGPGSVDPGLGNYTSGCYLSTGEYGNYLDLRFYLRKEFESSGQPKQVKVRASQNKNCRPQSDDPHYRGNVEILDAKYKLKAWIRQNPATSLLYIEVVFGEAEQVDPGELSPLAQVAQQAASDFLAALGVSVKPLPIEPTKTTAESSQKRRHDPDPDAEPDDIPF